MIENHPDLGAALGEDPSSASCPREGREQLLAGAMVIEIPHGGSIFSTAEAEDRIGVVVRGIARTYLNAVDGRRWRVRFAREGDTIGSITAPRAALSSQAVSDCTILQLLADGVGTVREVIARVLRDFRAEAS